MDKLKHRLKSAAIVLGSVSDGKVSLIAGVTDELTGKVRRRAGEFRGQQVGGKGGGRPDMAQAAERNRQAARGAAIGEVMGGATRMKRIVLSVGWPRRCWFWRTTAGAIRLVQRLKLSGKIVDRATSILTAICAWNAGKTWLVVLAPPSRMDFRGLSREMLKPAQPRASRATQPQQAEEMRAERSRLATRPSS